MTVRAKPSKTERMAEQSRARTRRAVRNRVLAGVAAVVVVAVIAGVNISSRRAGQRLVAELTAGSCEFDRRADGGRDHVASSTYRVNPPSGGDHSPSAASAGVYSEGDAPGDGELVHALEHGYVILWHRPDVTGDLSDVLDDIATRFERDVLVVPRASLEVPVAATAWHRRLLCPKAERQALSRFVGEYHNRGPEKVPH